VIFISFLLFDLSLPYDVLIAILACDLYHTVTRNYALQDTSQAACESARIP